MLIFLDIRTEMIVDVIKGASNAVQAVILISDLISKFRVVSLKDVNIFAKVSEIISDALEIIAVVGKKLSHIDIAIAC